MDIPHSSTMPGAVQFDVHTRTYQAYLRTTVVVAGVCWSVSFVVVGLAYGLQMYADGSLFSYAVAARNVWAFHWHNISGRGFVYLYSLLPAELYVSLTRNPRAGIAVYGLLYFAAQLLGLMATFAADRSRGRLIFVFACASTACFCPLVFGFPTEMWIAHALFWPTLALALRPQPGMGHAVMFFVMLLALTFSHEGALVLDATIIGCLLLRGRQDIGFTRGLCAFAAAAAIWIAVKMILRPDPLFSDVLARAALHFFDITTFFDSLTLLLLGALSGFGAIFYLLQTKRVVNAHIYAAAVITVALAIYWFGFDHALHAYNRYYMRTPLLAGTVLFGVLAAVFALNAEQQVRLPLRVAQWLPAFARPDLIQAAIGAVVLISLVHAVETAKFVTAWTGYKAAIRTLAASQASDPALGDPRFVSSARIDAASNRLAWNSTTPYLTVLLAPNFAPDRLVVDPTANYFWFSCATAKANEHADRALSVASRRLIRVYACRHP